LIKYNIDSLFPISYNLAIIKAPAGERRIRREAQGIFAWKGENPGSTEGATFSGEAFAEGIVPGGKEPSGREKR
jgi:hypothetical protein